MSHRSSGRPGGSPAPVPAPPDVREMDAVTVRFCGDAGDGVHLAGALFTRTASLLGNDVHTLPDFPAEIRAPAGTLANVTGFQVRFARCPVHTPGDRLDALVALNPAALKANLPDLLPGGLLVVNTDKFTPDDLAKAGYERDPLADGSLSAYRLVRVPLHTLNREAVVKLQLTPREVDRCRSFFALGLAYWLYERPLEPTKAWIRARFDRQPDVYRACARALAAGYHYGETLELLPAHYRVAPGKLPPGRYRRVTGHEAMVLGLVAAAKRAGRELLFAGYPITPASDLLHRLADLARFGVKTVQAEDEIAAIGMALGAAFGGAIGATATSGPGLCLQSEAIGLAVIAELPLVVIDVQRGGPSTGLPTKTEQADLLQALFGRNGESPVVVLAPATPGDCFAVTVEAVRLATRFMTPVLVLSDAHVANASEPWAVPQVEELPDLRRGGPARAGKFLPYGRDAKLARPWVAPGTPGCEHRVGSLEKRDGSGDVTYDPDNHERMTHLRAQKIANVADAIPPLTPAGPDEGDLLVVGWGGTFGAIRTAVERARRKGLMVAHAHLRHLNPLPANTGAILKRYRRVLVAELNGGQLRLLLRARYLVDAVGLNPVRGEPLRAAAVEEAIRQALASGVA